MVFLISCAGIPSPHNLLFWPQTKIMNDQTKKSRKQMMFGDKRGRISVKFKRNRRNCGDGVLPDLRPKILYH